jgi:polyhydroxybutyrate depolymerase
MGASLRNAGRQALGLALAVGLGACVLSDGGPIDAGSSSPRQARDAGGGNSKPDAGAADAEGDSGEEGHDAGEMGESSDAENRDSGVDAGADVGAAARDSGAGEGADSGAGAPSGDPGVDGGPGDDGGLGTLCRAKPGMLRGKVQASIQVGGLTRTFIYYAPARLDPNMPVPVVLLPHGYEMTAEDMFTLTGFKEIADREGFLAIFPNGTGSKPWNVGLNVSGVGPQYANMSADDQGFIDAILAYAEADQCLDKRHLFISGFGMGGYLSNESGCLRSDIAGLGPHSAGSHDLLLCPGTRKPVILFHGESDPYITYVENGVLARDRWAARNGCAREVEKRAVKGGTCDYSKGCPDHAQVALCHFDFMRHDWAGGKGSDKADASKESASELAWAFWKEYAW